jgi:hypothetical protein
MKQKVVGWNKMTNSWEVYDRKFFFVRSWHKTRERAEHAAGQLEMDI